jgi:deoxyribose-phosphate aldolase
VNLSLLTAAVLRGSIDYTLLNLAADEAAIRQLCTEAVKGRYASVCVRPVWVPLVAELLQGSGVKVCTVISFHLGIDAIANKMAEARRCIAEGANEIDWVFNYRTVLNFQNEMPAAVARCEVDAIAALAREFPAIVWKVIVETCALNDDQKRWICELLAQTMLANLFIKTSTGFGTPYAVAVAKGATVEDVVMFAGIIAACGSPMQIKASGGIRTLRDLLALRDAGATRFGIGSEGALSIMREAAQVGIE